MSFMDGDGTVSFKVSDSTESEKWKSDVRFVVVNVLLLHTSLPQLHSHSDCKCPQAAEPHVTGLINGLAVLL